MPERDRKAGPPASLRSVLAHAWGTSAFTTTDAMSGADLTRSTTIEALDRLVDLGLLRELENARDAGQYRLGRPSRRFALRSDAAAVVGVDAGQLRLTASVANLRGEVLTRLSATSASSDGDPPSRRHEIQALVDEALEQAGLGRGDVLALCVGVPAAVGPSGDSPDHRLGFWQAMNPDLQASFAQWVPLVRVENDASLAAVAEGAAGAATSSRDYVALLAGQRFGIGAVVDGRLLYGAHGAAGEPIALQLITGIDSAAGLAALIAQWARSDASGGRLPSGHPAADVPLERLTSRTVLDLAASGDAWASELSSRAASVLTRVSALLASLYDPEWIVISGAPSVGLGRVIDEANTLLPGELHGPAPRIVASALGQDVVVTGSVIRAVDVARQGALAHALQQGRI